MTNLIPDEHVQILWNESDKQRVTEVCVIDFRDSALVEAVGDNYENSNGACTDGWLSDVHPIANPAGLFGHLAFINGFESVAVARECVKEFSSIESADWARKMYNMIIYGSV